MFAVLCGVRTHDLPPRCKLVELCTGECGQVSEMATMLRVSILSRFVGAEPAQGATPQESLAAGRAAVHAGLQAAMGHMRDAALPIQAGGINTLTALIREKHAGKYAQRDGVAR